MSQIRKHSFEAVSLLTAENGQLEVVMLPVHAQSAWVVPKMMILATVDSSERLWGYEWEGHEVPVLHLLPESQTPSHLVILEGNTTAHRVAVQIAGDIQSRWVRISDVKDIGLNELISDDSEEAVKLPYIYQPVQIDEVAYVVPDIDSIAHQLIDLDS